MSWVPALQFNECLYAESGNMSVSTSLPWHYSYSFPFLEFMMFSLSFAVVWLLTDVTAVGRSSV